MMRVYLSHKIRGEKGLKATATEMKENCDEAIKIANELREVLPGIDFYVPGEHEDFVQVAFQHGWLNEDDILDIDCRIMYETCQAIVVYLADDDEIQGGRKVEHDFAKGMQVPVMIFRQTIEAIEWLRQRSK